MRVSVTRASNLLDRASADFERPGMTFHKTLTHAGADAEIRGWHQVAEHLPVPDLYGRTRRKGSDVVSYADVFATGRCDVLFGDLIALADNDPAMITQVEQLVDAVCRSLCRSAEVTGRAAKLGDCVPHLYLDRLKPGGRIDQWWLHDDISLELPEDGPKLSVRDLAGYELQVGDRAFQIDLEQIIAKARRHSAPDSVWLSALTQGDPTEPNIASPLCWFDFEHAGLNTLPGEIANLLWYLLGLGGWLVPRYQPDVYARTLHLAWPPKTTPTMLDIEHAPRTHRIVSTVSWQMGEGRRAALSRLVSWIRGDLGAAAGLDTENPLPGLRGFLATRILGVIQPQRLGGNDLLLILAKLAESQHPDTQLETLAEIADAGETV
jgi:hypothetical protein